MIYINLSLYFRLKRLCVNQRSIIQTYGETRSPKNLILPKIISSFSLSVTCGAQGATKSPISSGSPKVDSPSFSEMFVLCFSISHKFVSYTTVRPSWESYRSRTTIPAGIRTLITDVKPEKRFVEWSVLSTPMTLPKNVTGYACAISDAKDLASPLSSGRVPIRAVAHPNLGLDVVGIYPA